MTDQRSQGRGFLPEDDSAFLQEVADWFADYKNRVETDPRVRWVGRVTTPQERAEMERRAGQQQAPAPGRE